MNIFASDPCPHKSALWLCDIRTNKMILESAQMLSTAISINGGCDDGYAPTHPNHPSNVWCRSSRQNFRWLLTHMKALGKCRNGKHASLELVPLFQHYAKHGEFPSEALTPVANCARRADMGIDFTHVKSVTKAYRLYLVERWVTDEKWPTWKHGEMPKWAKQVKERRYEAC